MLLLSPRFLGKGDKREKVVIVKKPATPEDVENVKDRVGVNGRAAVEGTWVGDILRWWW